MLALRVQQASDIGEREQHKPQVRRVCVATENVRAGVEHVVAVHEHLDVIVPVHRLQSGIGDRLGRDDIVDRRSLEKAAGRFPVVVADLPDPHVDAALAAFFDSCRPADRLDHRGHFPHAHRRRMLVLMYA